MHARAATSTRIPAWWPWALCALLGLSIVVFAWPGTLIGGSSDQLAEIRSGHLTDWSPPLMGLVWRAMGASPQSMIILDAIIYWSGIALLADQLRRTKGNRWALAIIATGLSPLSVYYLCHVQKDTLMVALLVLTAGLVARFGKAYAIAPAILGALTRANAVFAAPPFFIRAKRPFVTIMLCLAVSVALVPSSNFINRSLLGAKPSHNEKSLQLFDIAGSGGAFARCYVPFEWDTLQGAGCDAFNRTPDDITRPWLDAIAAHPFAYARHRISYFNHAIFFLVPPLQECVYLQGHCTDQEARALLKDALARNPLVWPVTWLVVGLLLLAMPLEPLARTIALSATIYGMAYLVVGVATGFWYFYWTEFGVQLALVWQLAHGLKRWRVIAIAVLATWIAGYCWRYLPLLV